VDKYTVEARVKWISARRARPHQNQPIHDRDHSFRARGKCSLNSHAPSGYPWRTPGDSVATLMKRHEQSEASRNATRAHHLTSLSNF